MDNLQFIIPGKPEYLTMIRLAIGSIATTAGFDLDACEDIKTAVSEACKNVSCHGFDGFSDKYELQCNVEKGRIEIIIKDDCDEHTLQKLAKPCQNCPKEGELGIFVIQSLMNEVTFGKEEDGHKSIRMVKFL
ncbi:ATP-binding protein [Ihubacter sp. rT4E-8]|uniref:ATP-binding protein n=1 Tax=Ihubacter sp. rT4E-8 TaxID=3242369 RepID=UPI003CEA4D44